MKYHRSIRLKRPNLLFGVTPFSPCCEGNSKDEEHPGPGWGVILGKEGPCDGQAPGAPSEGGAVPGLASGNDRQGRRLQGHSTGRRTLE